jgi:predicted 3-demethylubiquinone-9 3-methyltransferase (glyoxalase superfamily)
MQKITTFLWFDHEAEEAANFYVSIFKNSKVLDVNRFRGPDAQERVTVVKFELDGQQFIALNGGPHFKFTEAISLYVNCATQQEVDELWTKLTAGGLESQCGWLKDRYGLSWQIVPGVLTELLSDPDPARSQRVMKAMLQMKKINIEALKRAHAG